jgi:hypothetical protein
VQTARGPVTVILLTDTAIDAEQRFEENSYRGMLVPMQHGGMAVIAQDEQLIESVANQVRRAIAFD